MLPNGTKIIKSFMKQTNIDSLPRMNEKANELSAKFVIWTMVGRAITA